MSIQEDGDIRLHGREGILVVFEFMTDLGNPRDMTGASVTFETDDYIKALIAGGQTNQMVLSLNAADLPANHINKKTPYIIRDNSGTVPHVIIDAELIVTGWR